MMKCLLESVVLLLVLACPVQAQRMLPSIPDTIFFNGKIVTVDDDSNVYEAMAVKDDIFIAVGSTDEVQVLAGPATQRIDLRGHTVVPGLIDNHNHQYHVGLLTQRGVDMQNVGSLAEMLDRLQQAVRNATAGETVYTTVGWNPASFPEKKSPSREDLDRIAPNNPVVVYFSRGRIHLNTAALDAFGITRETANTERIVFGKDKSGEADGVISGSGAAVLEYSAKLVPQPDLDENKQILFKMQAQQHAMGLTGIRDLQLRPEVMRAYFDLWREGALTLRTSMGLELNAGEEEQLEQMLAPWGVGTSFGDKWLRLDGIAEFNPGDMMREPYTDRGDNDTGEMRLSVENFNQAILTMNRYGWRPSIHISGDKTLDLVLDAYEAADRERPIRDKRWIVEHIPVVHPEQMQRLQKLGVLVSAQFQPYARATTMLKELGKQRLERMVPMQELQEHGLIVSGGSDWPGSPNNPFLNIYFYVTRKTVEGEIVGAAQKISRDQALRVMSINNAWMTFDEKIKGSIEPGKLADFVILSDDLMTVPEEQMLKIHPLATWVGGRKVYAKPGADF